MSLSDKIESLRQQLGDATRKCSRMRTLLVDILDGKIDPRAVAFDVATDEWTFRPVEQPEQTNQWIEAPEPAQLDEIVSDNETHDEQPAE